MCECDHIGRLADLLLDPPRPPDGFRSDAAGAVEAPLLVDQRGGHQLRDLVPRGREAPEEHPARRRVVRSQAEGDRQTVPARPCVARIVGTGQYTCDTLSTRSQRTPPLRAISLWPGEPKPTNRMAT